MSREGVEFNDDVSFFGEDVIADPSAAAAKALKEVTEGTTVELVEDEDDGGVTTIDKKPKPKAAEVEEEVSFFEEGFEAEEVEEVSTARKQTPAEQKVTAPSAVAFNLLKEKGFFDHELEEGKELTEEEYSELLEDKWEESIEEAVETTVKDLPQEGKDFLKFVAKGGDPAEFLRKLAAKSTDPITKGLDLEAEANQTRVIAFDLQQQGYDEEYIEAHVQTLKDTGKLPAISKKIYEKRLAEKGDVSQQMLQAQAEAKKAQAQRQKEFTQKMREFVTTKDSVLGYKLSKKDKDSLPDFASKATIALEDGRQISPLQAGLYKAMADPEKLILLSKIVEADFNLSFVANKAITEDTKRTRGERANLPKERTQARPKRDLLEIIDED